MELILLKDIDNLGHRGDVVNVRDGFARNFLIPRNLGLAATRQNREFVEEQKVRAAKQQAKRRDEAMLKAKELEKIKITLEAAAGEQNKLFGAITADDIRKVLSDKGYEFDKRRIHLPRPIRTVGNHSVSIEIYPQVKSTITVEVIRKS